MIHDLTLPTVSSELASVRDRLFELERRTISPPIRQLGDAATLGWCASVPGEQFVTAGATLTDALQVTCSVPDLGGIDLRLACTASLTIEWNDQEDLAGTVDLLVDATCRARTQAAMLAQTGLATVGRLPAAVTAMVDVTPGEVDVAVDVTLLLAVESINVVNASLAVALCYRPFGAVACASACEAAH
ncbi:MAG: hypothetical protein IPM45_04145 [Acidimicrobiales bacterium]|nr:hypothetical protein [Acidimicrobiales bacterium]